MSQVEWAEQIKPRVGAEFDRVAEAFKVAATKQGEQDRMDTHAVIAILEEKRAEVMAQDRAGYGHGTAIGFVAEMKELLFRTGREAHAEQSVRLYG